jgi:hypothetical protein
MAGLTDTGLLFLDAETLAAAMERQQAHLAASGKAQ